MFHMLSHTDGEGGKSLLVDGFSAAAKLFEEDQKAYFLLSTSGVHWHASGNDDVSIQPNVPYPVLNHDPMRNNLMQIRWNNSDRGGLDIKHEGIDAWYDAAA